MNDPLAELAPGAFQSALSIVRHTSKHASTEQRIELVRALYPDVDELWAVRRVGRSPEMVRMYPLEDA